MLRWSVILQQDQVEDISGDISDEMLAEVLRRIADAGVIAFSPAHGFDDLFGVPRGVGD